MISTVKQLSIGHHTLCGSAVVALNILLSASLTFVYLWVMYEFRTPQARHDTNEQKFARLRHRSVWRTLRELLPIRLTKGTLPVHDQLIVFLTSEPIELQ